MFEWIRRISRGPNKRSTGEASASGKTRTPGVMALLGALAVTAVVVFGDRGLWDLLSLHQERNELSREVRRLRTDIHALQAEYKEYGSSPAAVERAAREELNLVKPGETIYKFGADRP